MRSSLLIVNSCASVLLLAFTSARASTDINFDSVNASSSPYYVTGSPVTSYLSGFGITLSNFSNANGPNILNENYYGPTAGSPPYYMVPSSGTNMFTWGTPNDNAGGSFDMSFATPESTVSVTRVAVLADSTHNPSGFAYPTWSIEALSASDAVLGTIGESATGYFSDIPASTFTLGPYASPIAELVLSSNTNDFAAAGGPTLDDLTLTAVPEPASVSVLVLGAAGLLMRRTRRSSRGC